MIQLRLAKNKAEWNRTLAFTQNQLLFTSRLTPDSIFLGCVLLSSIPTSTNLLTLRDERELKSHVCSRQCQDQNPLVMCCFVGIGRVISYFEAFETTSTQCFCYANHLFFNLLQMLCFTQPASSYCNHETFILCTFRQVKNETTTESSQIN